jgi:hypothetical protein
VSSNSAAAALPGWPRPVYVQSLAALSAFGVGWRGLAAFVRRGERPAALEVPALAANDEPCEPRQRKLMSRAAYLGAAAIKLALRARGGLPAIPNPGTEAGVAFYMGVGASGGDMAELEAMLRASVDGGRFDLGRFGAAGLTAANPLFAFQLMNNFTLCHGAILGGLQGANSAFFSRGAGTVTALREAAFAVASDEAAIALAGGSDSALHPVTREELVRGGWIARDLAPAEGAALLALGATAAPDQPQVRLTRAEVHVARGGSLGEAAAAALAIAPGSGARRPAALVICPWGAPVRTALAAAAEREMTGREILDASVVLGDALAAAPALGWAVAHDWLSETGHEQESAVVLSAGIDGELGVVELTGGEAP